MDKLVPSHIRQEHARLSYINPNEYENVQSNSTQFLRTLKAQLLGLRQVLEHDCDFLSMFHFSCAKNSVKFIKSYFFPFLFTNESLHPLVPKKRTSSTLPSRLRLRFWKEGSFAAEQSKKS